MHRLASSAPPASHLPDPRLTLISTEFPHLLPHRHILDIGCNAGRTTVSAALHFSAASATGIDLDPALIVSAKSHLSFVYSRLEPELHPEGRPREVYFPVSAVQKHGQVPYPLHTEEFPRNVRFEDADVLQYGGEGVDVVLMLSVLKWVHLWGGDEGLMKVLGKVEGWLEGGGWLVLEVQEWASYEKAVKKNPALRGRAESLGIRPEGLGELLEGRGWKRLGEVGGKRRIEIWGWGARGWET